ncbi:hypothetical protein [Clostridium sp. UBA4548]|uniref:hypothetical protein n=1 Tax=Clostridium sp. UBA4548 TaxID=1946361 RepID=UPI0025C44E6F|nr:hypothetical protein [Clostridium sp. UBA4548]
MKKGLKVLVTCCAISIVFAGCQSKNEDSGSSMPVNNSISSAAANVPEGYKAIGEIREKNIYLFGKEGEKAGYEKIIVQGNGSKKEFDWKSVRNTPTIALCDLNNDGKEELIIILTTGYGTGFLEQKIHVVNLENMSEYEVKSPVDIARSNIKVSLCSEKVIFSLNEKEVSYSIKDKIKTTAEEEFKNLTYGTFIMYYLEDNKIKAKIDAAISPNFSLAEFEITYKYSEEGFIPENLKIDKDKK